MQRSESSRAAVVEGCDYWPHGSDCAAVLEFLAQGDDDDDDGDYDDCPSVHVSLLAQEQSVWILMESKILRWLAVDVPNPHA